MNKVKVKQPHRRTKEEKPDWNVLMNKVWLVQKSIKAADRVPNPILQERQRRRR